MVRVKQSVAVEEDVPSYLEPLSPNRNFCVKTDNIQKRFSFAVNDDESDAIAVYLRIKPNDPNAKVDYLSYDETGNHITLKKKAVCKEYKFTHIFSPNSSQPEVYKTCALPCANRLLQGQDSFIFTYGVSNSGKTFTVHGKKNSPGLIPRTLVTVLCSLGNRLESNSILCPLQGTPVVHLSSSDQNDVLLHKKLMFSLADSMVPHMAKSGNFICLNELRQLSKEVEKLQINHSEREPCSYSLWLSFYEIYDEKVYDLFDKPREKRNPLRIVTNKVGSVYVKDLNHIQVSTLDEALLLYMYARSDLCVGATGANENSSRSHSIFTMKLIAHPPQSCDTYFFCSSLSICDLAGTERTCRTRTTGLRLREAKSINKSFLVLNRCISILRDNQNARVKNVVPYRESKLTQVLGPSFTSGQSKLAMVVTLSLDNELIEETEHCLISSSVATYIKTLPLSCSIPQKETRFNLAISKCQPGQTCDWKAVVSNLPPEDRSKDKAGCEPDVYKELKEEKKARLKAEAKLNELVKELNDLRYEKLMKYDKKIKSLKEKNEELEEEGTDYRVKILKLKKDIYLANEEKKKLETAQENVLEILEEAQQEVVNLKEIIKEKDRVIISQEEYIQSLLVDKNFLEETILLCEKNIENVCDPEEEYTQSLQANNDFDEDTILSYEKNIENVCDPENEGSEFKENLDPSVNCRQTLCSTNVSHYALRTRSCNIQADASTLKMSVKKQDFEDKDCNSDFEDIDSSDVFYQQPKAKTTGRKKKKKKNNIPSYVVSPHASTGSRRKLFLRSSKVLDDNLELTRSQDRTIYSPTTILKHTIKAKRF